MKNLSSILIASGGAIFMSVLLYSSFHVSFVDGAMAAAGCLFITGMVMKIAGIGED